MFYFQDTPYLLVLRFVCRDGLVYTYADQISISLYKSFVKRYKCNPLSSWVRDLFPNSAFSEYSSDYINEDYTLNCNIITISKDLFL